MKGQKQRVGYVTLKFTVDDKKDIASKVIPNQDLGRSSLFMGHYNKLLLDPGV